MKFKPSKYSHYGSDVSDRGHYYAQQALTTYAAGSGYGEAAEGESTTDYTTAAAALRELLGIGKSDLEAAGRTCEEAQIAAEKAKTSVWPMSAYYESRARTKAAACEALRTQAGKEQLSTDLDLMIKGTVMALLVTGVVGGLTYSVYKMRQSQAIELTLSERDLYGGV